MAYQQGIFGKENKVLTKLFPGWKENGELVSFMYPITVGRHVLEPAGLVPLSENYQVELESYWMKPDYSVSADVRYASYVFQSCKKLKEVTLPGTNPAEGIDLSRGVFAGCSALERSLSAILTEQEVCITIRSTSAPTSRTLSLPASSPRT